MADGNVTPLPEVRQCADPADPLYGAVAVATEIGGYAWGVMHPRYGGHWETADGPPKDWAVQQEKQETKSA